MSSIPTYSIGLGPQELSLAFPFHVAFDGESRIVQVGSVLERLLPDIRPGTNFLDHFRIERPDVEPSFDAIREQSDVFFMLESCASKTLVLRGQMLPLESRRAIVFLGSPWLTEVAELKNLRLSIRDFALHDPISDFLFLLQAHKASLADAGLLADKLAGLNKELEERVARRTADLRLANRELEQEISERERAERALHKSEREHRRVTDNVPALIASFDSKAHYRLVNRKYAEWVGVPSDQIIGKHPREVLGESNYQKIRLHVETALSGQETSFEIELRARGGLKRWSSAIYVPEWGDDGTVQGFYALISDISERKWAEEEKSKLQKQIHQIQKLEAIGTLAGGIAHDFNNLLWVILGNTEQVLRKLPEESPIRTNLENVRIASKRAGGLVDQILTFSRQSEGESRPVSLQNLVMETLELLTATLPATMEIETNIDHTCGPVFGDVSQLQQVIMNLCTNSYNAMGERGILTIRVARVEIECQSGSDLAEAERSGPYVLLEVGDTGSGIDPKIMEKIFDPFFTTREVGKGTGLGLATVHGVVAGMGGFIRVSSELGKGTTFRIHLPEIDPLSTPVSEEAQESTDATHEGEQVLVVDDEPQVLAILHAMLKELGYIVTACPDGERAVEVIRAEPDRFHLIITDQTMPKLTGEELIQQLHQIRPHLPVILATGLSHVVSEENFREHGACALLKKPVGYDDLARVVQKALQESRR